MKNNNNIKIGDLVRHKNGGFYNIYGIGIVYKFDGLWAYVHFLKNPTSIKAPLFLIEAYCRWEKEKG